MHKGARFYRCDFQVHTPRDRGWRGDGAVTQIDRAKWARALVAACRKAGLDSIAITDHHDTALYSYVRAAAESEVDASGNSLPPEKRLIIFPGMEVTLALPCQVLVLFDAALPIEYLANLPGALGFAPAAEADAQTAPVEKLGLRHPNEVAERLNSLSFLREKFIVLPHVAEGGHQTILRAGFDKHYSAFDGVGGYVDGDMPPHGTGARRILDGLDLNYGSKPLAVFQTSDSRQADFAKLGKHSTWVKWSSPTAEALRQSCLARQSRVSQVQPKLPSIAITRVDVSASRFLGKQNVFLSPQYNALIGGRGTGKSTLLEYTRWALCVESATTDDPDADPLPEHEVRSRALIEKTLADVKGTVRAYADVRGVEHVVERRSASAEASLLIKVGDEPFRPTTEDEVRRLVPVEAYSQKQLSSVGGNAANVLRFVLAPVAREVASKDDDIQRAADRIRSGFARFRSAERDGQEAERLRSEEDSLAKQRDALREQFSSIDPADAAILRSADGFAAERALSERWRADLEEAKKTVEGALADLARMPSPLPASPALPDSGEISGMHASLTKFYTSLRSDLRALADRFSSDPSLTGVQEADVRLQKLLNDAREKFKAARSRAQAHEVAIKEVESLSTRIGEIESRLIELDRGTAAGVDARAEYDAASDEWQKVIRARGKITAERSSLIEKSSQEMVRGQVRIAGDLSSPLEVLAEVARGSRLRVERFDGLRDYLAAQPDSFAVWVQAVDELLGLIGIRAEEATLPACPVLHAAGFANKDLRALSGRLDDESWMRVRLAVPSDAVTFEYRAREGEYIAFAQASAGQRATALMRVLLAEEGAPLIVDQPEDDLDNKIIHEIAADIWEAKTRRQLVFASHNANLVVNGDADLVIVFDYGVAGEQSSGVIRAEGAIDDKAVRTAIAEIMEGGRGAFQLRSDKYGF